MSTQLKNRACAEFPPDKLLVESFANNYLARRDAEWMGCGNLYAPENLELLAGLNCALYAGVLLERDKDYIVRNGKVELIDKFTGRIADKRHWPDNLQAAVEAKEGLRPQSRGVIMGLSPCNIF